jgi:hypothetical protein
MATLPLIPGDEAVYRGLSNANWCKRGIVNYRAFMLRPANERFPEPESELSLGRTPEAAVNELATHYGAIGLSVGDVHALPHKLMVVEDAGDSLKAYILGLPLFSTDGESRARALAMATDLAQISQPTPLKPSSI